MEDKNKTALLLPKSYSPTFLATLNKLVNPWSIVPIYDIFPALKVEDSIEIVPAYCYDIASPLSAHKFLYNLANELSS